MDSDNFSGIERFCRENDIAYLGLFGSYAEGKQRKNSDMDILVSFSKSKSLTEFVRIEGAMSRLFRKKIDLVTKNSLSPFMRKTALQQVKPLYEG